MPTLNANATIRLNGVTPIRIGGEIAYSWFNRYNDGLFFWSDAPGRTLTVDLLGSNWYIGVLRVSGTVATEFRDTASGSDRGLDAIMLYGSGNNRVSLQKTDANFIATGSGNDTITIGDVWVGSVFTHDGNDRVVVNSSDWISSINVGGGNNQVTVNNRGGGVEMITAGAGNDRIVTHAEVNYIQTGRGNDTVITGASWVEAISTGRGQDRVTLGAGGAEIINLGRDADTLIVRPQSADAPRVTVNGGGTVSTAADRDSDTVNFSSLTASVTADLGTGMVQSDQAWMFLREIENLVGGRGADLLVGNHEDNILSGLAGNDTLVGGAGADVLTGGVGADLFQFVDVDGKADRITDFRPAQGDQIDLSRIDANTGLAGDQAFVHIGAAGFSGVAGQLRVFSVPTRTTIQGDVDGDGNADFSIVLSGISTSLDSGLIL